MDATVGTSVVAAGAQSIGHVSAGVRQGLPIQQLDVAFGAVLA